MPDRRRAARTTSRRWSRSPRRWPRAVLDLVEGRRPRGAVGLRRCHRRERHDPRRGAGRRADPRMGPVRGPPGQRLHRRRRGPASPLRPPTPRTSARRSSPRRRPACCSLPARTDRPATGRPTWPTSPTPSSRRRCRRRPTGVDRRCSCTASPRPRTTWAPRPSCPAPPPLPDRWSRPSPTRCRRHGITACVYDGVNCQGLGGTTNVEGTHARQVGASFIHLELADSVRARRVPARRRRRGAHRGPAPVLRGGQAPGTRRSTTPVARIAHVTAVTATVAITVGTTGWRTSW